MTDIFDIATFGTSLTAGNASVGGRWQPHVARALAPGKSDQIRLYNLGIPGGSSRDGLAAIGTLIKLRPKAVTIEFLMNDCAPSHSVTLSQCADLTTQIVDAIRDMDEDTLIYLMTMNPSPNSDRAAQPTYNEVYRTLAGTLDVGLIDTYPLWPTITPTLAPDGVHTTLAANMATLTPAIASGLSPDIP